MLKVLRLVNGKWVAPYWTDFIYRLELLYRLRKALKPKMEYDYKNNYENVMVVNEGYHSFDISSVQMKLDRSTILCCHKHAKHTHVVDYFWMPSHVIVHAVIPKGAKYFIGSKGDMVSTSMVLIRAADFKEFGAK